MKEELRKRAQNLESRLAAGLSAIETAEGLNRDVTEWEQFWLQLLREYEALVDELTGDWDNVKANG